MLLVFGQLVTGGIQTLIVRIANHLAQEDEPIAVCCGYGPLVDQLDPRVTRLLWTDSREAREFGADWLRQQKGATIMVSFDPISAAYGLAIESLLPPDWPVSHISGVYHQRAYFMTGERRDRILLNRLVASAVGFPRLFFQNAETLNGHRALFGAKVDKSTIIPLGVAERKPQWINRGSQDLRIVSVGRLVDFKAYNLGAPAAVRAALDAGLEMTWDIYGRGPLTSAIKIEIDRHNVGSQVRLLGELPYAAFDATVAQHDVFVGCGTAALEAAMLGVPVIGVVDSSWNGSYGFLHDLPFGNTGELQVHAPTQCITELIERFRLADTAERQALSRQARAAALPYGMKQMVRALQKLADNAPAPASNLRKRITAKLYQAMTQSMAARLARKLRAQY